MTWESRGDLYGCIDSQKGFSQKRKKVETLKDAADEADQMSWRIQLSEIEEADSAVNVFEVRGLESRYLLGRPSWEL